MSTTIYCDEAIFTGEVCMSCVDRIDIPMPGKCDNCEIERRRRREARRSRETQQGAEHAALTKKDINEAAVSDTGSQNQIEKSQGRGIMYDDWNDEEEIVTDQHLYGLGLVTTPYTNNIVKEWMNNTELPGSPSAYTSVSCNDRSRRMGYAPKGRSRIHRSYIPAPVRKLQPRTQRSHIPVPVKMNHRWTTRQSPRPLVADEMQLFDLVTF
ncbi:uncharacterized protein N7498_010044 [Penicillium cinerascens]|uniref:Uncharacterized protein n=1 Tax=Penicillium cinerascens TaxID=70096 RepID=A0A9W9J788_9EURO|nr:uncharacterized protein N7498_010044 [Penicillium cinerascens]KAJ5191059.1 hypothetical protein N7498_010044 [Penicillium cinerascens]